MNSRSRGSDSDSDSDSDSSLEIYPGSVDEATEFDNKNAFLIYLPGLDPEKSDIATPEIMYYITSRYECFKCAKSILDGEAGYRVDWSAPVLDSPFPPLHRLAYNHFTSMIDLFLNHGAPPNLRCSSDDSEIDGMSPFNLALLSISTSFYVTGRWTTKQSVFNLIIRMCLPGMREPLKTVKLLASKTDNIDEEIFYYAREGRVVELSALLLVAHEMVLSPTLLQKFYGSDFAASTSLRQFITAEITLLMAMRITLEYSENYETRRTCEEKLAIMMHLLQLLEVFERVPHQLVAYIQLEQENYVPKRKKKASEEVAWILEQAGFTLNDEDSDPAQFYERKEMDDPVPTRPFKQWRFILVDHLSRSHSFSVQPFKIFHNLDGILNSSYEGGGSKCDNGLLKLSMSIEKLCHHQYLRDWNWQKSIFKLLYTLFLPELKEELESIKLSAHNCDKTGALGFYYAKEGKIIELAALLMVAREKLIPPTESTSVNVVAANGSIPVRECILSEMQRIIDMEVSLIGSCESERAVLSSALLLLEVFERAGDVLERYSHLKISDGSLLKNVREAERQGIAYDVVSLLEASGFVLTDKDKCVNDLACFQSPYKPKPKDLENLSRKIGMFIFSEPHNFSNSKKIDEAYRQQIDCSLSRPFLPLHAYNPVRSFHTSQIPKITSITSIMFSSPLENHPHRVPMLNFKLGERWMPFLLAINKGLKRI